MWKFSKLFLSAAILTMSISMSSEAKLPEEVKVPYKAYRAALAEKDKKSAKKYALEAWEAAEKHLGDHKTTGDLALNYASIMPGNEKNPYKNYEKRAKAYKRAIKLAHFYGEDAGLREVERRVSLATLEMSVARHREYRNKSSKTVGKLYVLKELEKAIAAHNMQGSTFDGDLHALYAQYYRENKQPEKALEYSDKAIALFENRTDNFFSEYEYLIRFFKGDSHVDIATKQKDENQRIKGALEYQYVMQNLEGKLEAEHPFINAAFQKWMSSRAALEDKGLLRDAEQAGLCECWPFENYKNKAVPIERMPGEVPRAALRIGRSGHVYLRFDVTDEGVPENISVVSSSDAMFHDSAIEAARKFKYSKYEEGTDRANRKGLTTKMTYRVTDYKGNILPE